MNPEGAPQSMDNEVETSQQMESTFARRAIHNLTSEGMGLEEIRSTVEEDGGKAFEKYQNKELVVGQDDREINIAQIEQYFGFGDGHSWDELLAEYEKQGIM